MSNHEREDSPSGVRDEALDRAWRQASDEQPSSSLDARILAAARVSTEGRGEQTPVGRVRPRSWNGLTRWQPLAAAAAVTGLAFVLLQSLPRDRDIAPPIRINEQTDAVTAAPQAPASPAAREASEAKAAPAAEFDGTNESVVEADPETRQRAVPARNETAPAVDVPSPAAVPPPLAADAAETTATAEDTRALRTEEVDQRKAITTDMAGRSAPATATAAAPAQGERLGDAAALSAVGWANRIEAQYVSGDVTGAAQSLRAFRAAHADADAYLPESLRHWARTVE